MKYLILIPFFFTLNSYANVVSNLSLFYKSNETNNVETTNTDWDFKLGIADGKLYYGLIYATEKTETGSSEQTRASYGPTLGYNGQNGFFHFSYFLASEYESGTVIEGTGYQIDLGYLFQLTGKLRIGPQLTYKSFEYDETDTGATVDVETTIIQPYMVLSYEF